MSKTISVCIDPGHGKTSKNKGPTGYYEYAGMWKLSNYLKAALLRCGFLVKVTRNEDEDPSLSKRGQTAKGFDLFISEHSNAANGIARGVEVYYSVQLPKDKYLASSMSKAISTLMNNPDRGSKVRESEKYRGEDYYDVMKYARRVNCPHVLLIESGFHDNPLDEMFLKQDNNLLAIAETQARVVCELFEMPYVPAYASDTGTKIMGASFLTPSCLAEYLLSKNPTPKLSCTPYELANHYIDEGLAEGIRGDMAFCQGILETGWFGFENCTAKPEQNNFCGLGVTGPNNPGCVFETPQYGVRAHIQHLKAYASTEPLNLNCIDPRFNLVKRGIAPYWHNLNGKWAVPGEGYGEHIVRLYEAALTLFKPEDKPEKDIESMLITLIDNSSINTPEYWINALEQFKYFDGFIAALYEKYERES